jgi:hypothetical protein
LVADAPDGVKLGLDMVDTQVDLATIGLELRFSWATGSYAAAKLRHGATASFHIPAQYPYADIYPVFIGGDVRRVDGVAFTAPVTPGHTFEGRPAIQVSRRSSTAQNGLQKATAKILKVLDFLARLP